MANEYRYGAYGTIADSVGRSAVQAETAAVYVGTAPVNLVRGYADKGAVNSPLKITSLLDAQGKLGYSQNWASFTLCEPITAHFDNTQGNIGPVYMINVLDPAQHKKAEVTTKALSFIGGRCEFLSDTIVLDTFAIDGKVEGTDYQLDYNFTRGSVIVSSLDAEDPLTGTIESSFTEVDPSLVVYADIVGVKNADGVYKDLGCISLMFPGLNVVTNLIGAPGWSQIPQVYAAMVQTAKKINGHWDAFIVADIPLESVATIDTAIAWKEANNYKDEQSKVCWPQVIDQYGYVFHLSTLAICEYLRIDNTHGGVPMETCANKTIRAIKQYFGENSANQGFDQEAANQLAQKGILTAVAWGGRWVLWGDHTAAYTFSTDSTLSYDPRVIFDVSMRMLMHITNSFQIEWGPEIDQPMTRGLKDRIINREQEKLDGYVSMGALIGDPQVFFLEENNPEDEMLQGHFRWDIPVTPTPPLKSASVYVAYTTDGFDAYFEEENTYGLD